MRSMGNIHGNMDAALPEAEKMRGILEVSHSEMPG